MEELIADYESGNLHPGDLKPALTKAINELRDELSKEKFGIAFANLKDTAYINAVQKAIPVAISEAEPENIGGEK